MNTPAANSQHFPDDSTWQKHCQMIARMREAEIRPIGLAPRVGAQMDSIPVVGRAA